jgi:hypothetical protein
MTILFYFKSCPVYSNSIGKVQPGPAPSVSVHVVCDPMDLSGAAATKKDPVDVYGNRGYPGLCEIAWDVMQGLLNNKNFTTVMALSVLGLNSSDMMQLQLRQYLHGIRDDQLHCQRIFLFSILALLLSSSRRFLRGETASTSSASSRSTTNSADLKVQPAAMTP